MNKDKIHVCYDDRFIMVNYDVIMSGQLTAYEITVYVALCAFANNHNHSCYPSYMTLAAKVGCSRSTAIRAITSLVEKGVIEKKQQINTDGEYQSNLYIICTNRKQLEKEISQSRDNASSISAPQEHQSSLLVSSSQAPYALAQMHKNKISIRKPYGNKRDKKNNRKSHCYKINIFSLNPFTIAKNHCRWR